MSVTVEPVALRAAADSLGACDEMLLAAGLDARRHLDTAAGAVGRTDVSGAVESVLARVAELFAALSAAHGAGQAGYLAAAAAYDEVEQGALSTIDLLSASFDQAVREYW
ncbi:hypothetical protein BH20ACT5_BH20ACT5_05040 [soil metagenome]